MPRQHLVRNPFGEDFKRDCIGPGCFYCKPSAADRPNVGVNTFCHTCNRWLTTAEVEQHKSGQGQWHLHQLKEEPRSI